jgi:hypothetical protein
VLLARRIRLKADRAGVESHRRCPSYDLKLDNLLLTGPEPSDDKLCPVPTLRSQGMESRQFDAEDFELEWKKAASIQNQGSRESDRMN